MIDRNIEVTSAGNGPRFFNFLPSIFLTILQRITPAMWSLWRNDRLRVSSGAIPMQNQRMHPPS